MNRELQLKLQAYLDGELPGWKARRLAAWIAADSEAQALLAELRATKAVVAENEPVLPVPESREFYWSKIERAILRAEQTEERSGAMPWWWAWQRFLAPAAAVALVAAVALFTAKLILQSGSGDAARYLDVVENLSEHTEASAFRSQSENMFVVWIHNKEDGQSGEAEFDSEDDLLYQ